GAVGGGGVGVRAGPGTVGLPAAVAGGLGGAVALDGLAVGVGEGAVAGAAGPLVAAAGIGAGVGLAGVRRDFVGAGPAVGRRVVLAVEAAVPAAAVRGAAGHGPLGMAAGTVDGAARLACRAVAVLPPEVTLTLVGRGARGGGGDEDEGRGRDNRHFPH